jgi:hypothetical protein
MFTLFRGAADTGHRMRNARSGVRVEQRSGRYFTDGVNLYRMVDDLGGSSGHALVGLEDCRSFEVVLMATSEFRALRLRPVRRCGMRTVASGCHRRE